MAIQAGDTVPETTFKVWTGEGMEDVSTGDVSRGKKVVLFAVPDAFTPTCSDEHLPGFITRASDLEAKGVDTIAGVAVNDALVMSEWAKARSVPEDSLMLADGNGEFARAMGLELDASGFGMG